jgi:hypothetical protein
MGRRRKKGAVIEYFEDLYHYVAGHQDEVAQVLMGHLAIEFLLRQLVCQYDPKIVSLADELSHARLISLNRDIGTVTPQRADVLVQINTLRNRFAHEIQYCPQIAEILALFKAASKAFTDYSDCIKEGIAALSSATSIYDLDKFLLSELFLAVIYDLHHEYVDRGGDEERPQIIT